MVFLYCEHWKRAREAERVEDPKEELERGLNQEIDGYVNPWPIEEETTEQTESPQKEEVQPSTLDDFLEEGTIDFPRRINGRELVKLLGYVSSQTGMTVIYVRKRVGRIDDPKTGKAKARDMEVKGVFMKPAKVGCAPDFFCREYFGHPGKFLDMHFSTLLGETLDELPPVVIETLKEIQSAVNSYFAKPRDHGPL